MLTGGLSPEAHGAYADSLAAFNRSAFARDRGLYEHPKAIQLAELEEVLARLPEDGTLVDIGTGTGIVPEAAHRLGYRVISIDQSDEGRLAEPLHRLMATGIEGVFAEVGAEPVPLADGIADVVFAGDVVEHIPHSPKPFMAEIFRLLRPGGWCVLTTPNAVRLPVRLKVALGFSNWMPLDTFYDLPRNFGHHKEYDVRELRSLFRRSSFGEATVRFIEDTLRRAQIAQSLGDLRTKNRFAEEGGRVDRFAPLNPMEYLRLLALGLVTMAPGLRSSMIGAARKPECTAPLITAT